MTNDNQNLIYQKAKFYLDNSIPVHINYVSGRWANGTIIDLPEGKEMLLLNEEKLGKMVIFFEEIASLLPRIAKDGL